MDVRLPDGTVVTGIPDGISKAELTNKLMANGYAKSLASAEDVKMADPTRDMGTFERIRAGYGKSVSDIGRGVQQLVTPNAPTLSGLVTGDNRSGIQQEIDESRRRDAPLMNTAGGIAGNIIGSAATVAPALAIPGANTVAGAALLGGAQGLVQPVETGGSRAINTAIGTAGGAGGQVIGNKLATVAGNTITNMAARKSQNAVRDATLEAGQKAGLVVPKSAVEPGFWTNRLEGIAGKAALGQQASHQNQEAVNAVVRTELGIPKNQAISEGVLEGIRRTEGQAYTKVASLSQNAADALEQLKQARFEANAQHKFYARSANPEALAKAKAAEADAGLWEKFLESEAVAAGKPGLVPEMHAARKKIAQSYDVERALNADTGNIDARILGRAKDSGRPLSGGLATVGGFANAFPRYMVEGAPAAGVSKLEGGLASLLAGIGGGTMGPAGVSLGALPLASPAIRAGLLSGVGQRLVAPSYQPGRLTQLMARPEIAPGLAALLPAAGLASGR